AGVLDDVGDVAALHVEDVRDIGAGAHLGERDDEAVREAPRLHAEQRRDAVLPLLAEGNAILAHDVVARAPLQRRANLEAAGKDDAVELVLDAVGDDALLRDAVDALAL